MYIPNWLVLLAVCVVVYLFYRPYRARKTKQLGNTLGDDDSFVVENDEMSHVEIDIDKGMGYLRRNNHFLLHSRYDICVDDLVYEYRIDGIRVSIQLIDSTSAYGGGVDKWDVRDGVVQEASLRAEKPPFLQTIDEKIEEIRKQTEWHELSQESWQGFKYFLLSKKVTVADARRYFREEIERILKGTAALEKAWGEAGYHVVKNKDGRRIERILVRTPE